MHSGRCGFSPGFGSGDEGTGPLAGAVTGPLGAVFTALLLFGRFAVGLTDFFFGLDVVVIANSAETGSFDLTVAAGLTSVAATVEYDFFPPPPPPPPLGAKGLFLMRAL